jgi:hypothetical protein
MALSSGFVVWNSSRLRRVTHSGSAEVRATPARVPGAADPPSLRQRRASAVRTEAARSAVR